MGRQPRGTSTRQQPIATQPSGELTYAEGLQVVDGDAIAEEVQQGILQHASVSVARKDGCVSRVGGHADERPQTHERTKRSLFSHLGFFGLNFMNLLKRTWATGAMPLVWLSAFCPSQACRDNGERQLNSHGGRRDGPNWP